MEWGVVRSVRSSCSVRQFTLSHFVARSIISMTLFLFPCSPSTLPQVIPLPVLHVLSLLRPSPSSLKLPSQYASQLSHSLPFSLSSIILLPLPLVVPRRKFSQTPTHARITLPRSPLNRACVWGKGGCECGKQLPWTQENLRFFPRSCLPQHSPTP